MKKELSAGGIVVTKTPKGWYVLVMRDMKGRWTFPKGLIEKNEQSVDTAKREIREEVGVSGPLTHIKALTPIEYFYRRDGLVKKTVFYFLFLSPTRARLTIQKAEGIGMARWIPLDKAIKQIDYKDTNVSLLTEAIAEVREIHKPYGNTQSA